MISTEPLSRKAYAKPERPTKRKLVTIGAGIMCPNGIVLCADTEETTATFKRYRPKLIELQLLSPDIKAVAVGATDDAHFLDALLDKLTDAIDRTDGYAASVKGAVEDKVLDYCSQIWSLYPTVESRPMAELLIGFKTIDDMLLLVIQTPIVRTVATSEFVGWGGELASYKAKQLLLSELPVEITATLAAHLLDVVKQNSRYCGGPTSMAVIRKDGTVDHKSPTYIENAARGCRTMSTYIEAFLLPALSAGILPSGKDLLTKLAEVEEITDEDKQKFATHISSVMSKRDAMAKAMESPEAASLAEMIRLLDRSITTISAVETNLYDVGIFPEVIHNNLQRCYELARTSSQHAKDSIASGDLVKARAAVLLLFTFVPPVVPDWKAFKEEIIAAGLLSSKGSG